MRQYECFFPLYFQLPLSSWVHLCGSKALNKDYFSTVAITRVLQVPWGRIILRHEASLSVPVRVLDSHYERAGHPAS